METLEPRDHLYRAWLTKDKEMVYDVFFDDLGVFVVNEDGDPVILGDQEPDSMLQHVILMQFIGQYDATSWDEATEEQRKGQEENTWRGLRIYEGDIVETDKGLRLVRYNQKQSAFKYYLLGPYIVSEDILRSGTNVLHKVVGDIFSTPEKCKESGK